MIYNCFISNNPDLPSIGNPSSVFLGEYTKEEMSKLAIKMGTPISCFVKVLEEEVHVTFFAPNGKEEGFCGHGLISVAKALKDKGYAKVKTVITESGTVVKIGVLKNGISSLKIPTKGFDISPFTDSKTINKIKKLFSLKTEVLEVFKAGKLGDLLFEVKDSTTLQNLKFENEEVRSFLKQTHLRAVMFFCKSSAFTGIDVEVRVFYVNLEELEDIACGSVNISLSRVLHQKYGITKYKTVQPFKYLSTGKLGGYQEISYNPLINMLTIAGFAEPKKERFRFETLNIEFDNNLNPISKNEDYYLLREILTDPEVMKTSTAFAGGLAENEYDLHVLMHSLIGAEQDYGVRKVFDLEIKEYLGVYGIINTNRKISNFENNVVEGARFLKSKYIGQGFGLLLDKIIAEKVEKSNLILIGSVWENHASSNNLLIKYGMQFLEKMQKCYKNKSVNINTYIKFPKSINVKYCKDIDIKELLISKKIF